MGDIARPRVPLPDVRTGSQPQEKKDYVATLDKREPLSPLTAAIQRVQQSRENTPYLDRPQERVRSCQISARPVLFQGVVEGPYSQHVDAQTCVCTSQLGLYCIPCYEALLQIFQENGVEWWPHSHASIFPIRAKLPMRARLRRP